jgi:hypothetical protein
VAFRSSLKLLSEVERAIRLSRSEASATKELMERATLPSFSVSRSMSFSCSVKPNRRLRGSLLVGCEKMSHSVFRSRFLT